MRLPLVAFKVSNASKTYAAIVGIAGMPATEMAEALHACSRLDHVSPVESLRFGHNMTDLAGLMKISNKLPPVLMREYRDTSALMAVFTRHATG